MLHIHAVIVMYVCREVTVFVDQWNSSRLFRVLLEVTCYVHEVAGSVNVLCELTFEPRELILRLLKIAKSLMTSQIQVSKE